MKQSKPFRPVLSDFFPSCLLLYLSCFKAPTFYTGTSCKQFVQPLQLRNADILFHATFPFPMATFTEGEERDIVTLGGDWNPLRFSRHKGKGLTTFSRNMIVCQSVNFTWSLQRQWKAFQYCFHREPFYVAALKNCNSPVSQIQEAASVWN